MEYCDRLNPLLEAVVYLGRKTTGNTWERMEEQICKKGMVPSAAFSEAMQRLKAITTRLDAVELPEDILPLFANLEGFPRNTIGSASRAFFLLYGFLEEYTGDFEALVQRARHMTRQQRAYHLALALDMAEECPPEGMEEDAFWKMVLSLSIPDGGKIAIMETYRDFPQMIARLSGPMTRLLKALHREMPAMEALSDMLEQKMQTEDCGAYLSKTSSFTPAQGVLYRLRPFVFGMDTDLTTDCGTSQVCMYCGILREELLDMLSALRSARDSVFDAFRLLGDKTRFELVCYLSDHSAYGQELSQRFDLSRNTIHHHMTKLSECGLVRCTADGNRVYYTLNRDMIRRLLEFQKELLCKE